MSGSDVEWKMLSFVTHTIRPWAQRMSGSDVEWKWKKEPETIAWIGATDVRE
jgi:hypothetical protein